MQASDHFSTIIFCIYVIICCVAKQINDLSKSKNCVIY
jgi:hypothetical protein